MLSYQNNTSRCCIPQTQSDRQFSVPLKDKVRFRPDIVFFQFHIKVAFGRAEQGGLDFLRRLKPRRIFLYHLPLPEDDVGNYHAFAHSICRKPVPGLAGIETLEAMSWIDGLRSEWETA
jgi:hypothetical protein